MPAIKFSRNDSGQLILPFAALLTGVVLFAGLSLDAGILYITKARLSNAVDSACMTGVKNLWQGQSTAAAVATNVFNANYGSNPPTPTITFPTDAYGNQEVNVTATANVTTLFIGILSPFKVLPVTLPPLLPKATS